MKAGYLNAKKRAFIALLLANNMNIEATCKARSISVPTARKWFRENDFKAELQRRQDILSAAADITAHELIGLFVTQARADMADILPDNPIVKEARLRGVSHLIKKIEVIEEIERKPNGTTGTVLKRRTKIELVDASKAAIQLCKLMGLEMRDDELERARTAVRTCMAMKGCSPEEAISILVPHFPAVIRLRDEFAGKLSVIDIERIEKNASNND